ncbi:Na+/H+ antiporter subunit E [Paramaledivibacter caminithermalis]|jgi:multicomponent Na+:H+ antiporter subunit E|uniref:Multisubunit sodium/proton antiporter, MrpE subunit n=1 Tax=Paramaledivibacter caminithermalis (strain DSM 15212 / CIP 107654 / DViRD3) TaxID=1121301 RepID=A0A1M6NYU4_PARC5|nr:Na+/H+ antiporter subunit E [Paramaledivibacter caminithermalis]SHK00866.1 multisubunit sodium/proton antiporter, MrpE subunit [Paramaledivibacter caminithermalis DSM 15212]
MKRDIISIKALVLYMIFWIILAEKIDFQVLLIGLLINIMIYLFNKNGESSCHIGKRYQLIKRWKLFICYILLLMKEIVIASIDVASIVLSRELNISPRIIKFKTRLKGDLLKTILANSITLTPGTLTIEVKNDEFTVHCITKNQITGVKNSKFEELLLKIEEQ